MSDLCRHVDEHFVNDTPDLEFLERIGSGSFGYVFKVEDRRRGTIVAIKRSIKTSQLISREYKMLQKVRGSPYCVGLLDIFYTVNVNRKYIQNLVFEYIPGNLGKKIRRYHQENRQFSDPEIKCIMGQLLDGVSFIHRKGIMHRDLKPDNV